MGNFAENLNLGNRFQPPLRVSEIWKAPPITQGNYATVGSAIVAIAIVGRGGWAGLSSTVAI